MSATSAPVCCSDTLRAPGVIVVGVIGCGGAVPVCGISGAFSVPEIASCVFGFVSDFGIYGTLVGPGGVMPVL